MLIRNLEVRSSQEMNVYYYLINLWPLLIILGVIVIADGFKKNSHKPHTDQIK